MWYMHQLKITLKKTSKNFFFQFHSCNSFFIIMISEQLYHPDIFSYDKKLFRN